MNINFSSIYSSILTITLSTMSTVTVASTPDGLTPKSEVICDGLKDASKGLYGLCIAYCEATDSPEDLSSEENIAALPKFSAQILENYNKKRQAGDPQMPCGIYYKDRSCPAWTSEQINSVGTHITSASEGFIQERYDDKEYITPDSKTIFDLESVVGSERSVDNMVLIYSSSFGTYGRFKDHEKDNITGLPVRLVHNTIPLTDEEYAACEAEIRAHIMPTQSP